MQFLALYGKTYATKHDLSSRFQVFAENYEAMKKHNERADADFKMGINKFFDMTHEEFAKVYMPNGLTKDLSKQKKKIHLEAMFKQEDTTPAPENVDWKAAGKVSIPGD